jgi:hypothetical protein
MLAGIFRGAPLSILVIDETRSKIDRISTDEWRVIRVLRLLDSAANGEVFSALANKVAGMLEANEKIEANREERIDNCLAEAADRAIPVDDIFGLLVDHGRIDDWRGAEAIPLMIQTSDDLDDVASAFVSAYRELVDDHPAYMRIHDLYPDLEPREAESAFHDTMLGIVHEWRENFIERLEEAVAQFRQREG